MQGLISANELAQLSRSRGKKSAAAILEQLFIPCDLPYDFRLYTNSGSIALERKRFPSDFVASIRDGRFSSETAAMREDSKYCFIIVEGKPKYKNGYIAHWRYKDWSKHAINNVCRSLRFIEGCDIEHTDNIFDTIELLKELQDYFDKTDHMSMRARPRLVSDWFSPTQEERYINYLQGFPNISIKRARVISKVFPNPLSIAVAYTNNTLGEKLKSISGIGDKIISDFIKFWEG